MADTTIERLAEDITALCAELSVQLARWLELVAEFDRRRGALQWGHRGTAEWLAWHCGLSQRAARDHVRVARGLHERPLVRAAFASGELSYSKVRALTRVPLEHDESALLEVARSETAGQLERTVRGLRTMPSADVAVANAAHARRYVDWYWEPDGSLAVRGRLPAEEGATFVDALERAAVALYDGPSESCEVPPPLGARRADALAEMVLSGAPRAQVVVHVDEPALACTAEAPAERAGEVCQLEDGPAIPSETARRLACDAELAVARAGTRGGAVDYGRKRRVVSPSLRAALERRDRGCRYPGCERRHDLHAHHVRHWVHGGATNRDNLVLLCRFHHRLVHEEGFTVERGRPGGNFRFRRPDGREVPHGGATLPPQSRAAVPRSRARLSRRAETLPLARRRRLAVPQPFG